MGGTHWTADSTERKEAGELVCGLCTGGEEQRGRPTKFTCTQCGGKGLLRDFVGGTNTGFSEQQVKRCKTCVEQNRQQTEADRGGMLTCVKCDEVRPESEFASRYLERPSKRAKAVCRDCGAGAGPRGLAEARRKSASGE